VDISPSRWRVEPWKNGGGSTSVVLRMPDSDPYNLRISVAEVTASGPFSVFPGYRRYTTLLEGGPISLEVAGVVRPLARGSLLELDGEVAVVAHVEAPARLLNVLVRASDQPTNPIGVGYGETERASIVFAVEATGDLARWHTRVAPSPMRATGDVVWIRL
jgi:environmental stress-induced protein Ves